MAHIYNHGSYGSYLQSVNKTQDSAQEDVGGLGSGYSLICQLGPTVSDVMFLTMEKLDVTDVGPQLTLRWKNVMSLTVGPN